MRFSQRIGLTPKVKLAKKEEIDAELRNSLWSLLTIFYWETYRGPSRDTFGQPDYVRGSTLFPLIQSLWLHYFKKPTDSINEFWEYCLESLRKYYFNANWYEIYDFVEFIAAYGPSEVKQQFTDTANFYFERENSAYRFVDGLIVEITSEAEIEEVEIALDAGGKYQGVETHLKTALMLLADRANPDYRNSIKESISAVESLAKQLSGNEDGTLGAVLKTLENEKKLHPAMVKAFASLYGYTSDANGIRHALLEESNLTKADARFMLVICSAFVNYSVATIK
jgi:AbiJ N-terminal domain 4